MIMTILSFFFFLLFILHLVLYWCVDFRILKRIGPFPFISYSIPLLFLLRLFFGETSVLRTVEWTVTNNLNLQQNI